MTKIEEQKLTIANTRKNPLRDKLRAMNNDQLRTELTKSLNAYNRQDTRANFNYYMFVSYLCETRGIIKTPGICV